MLSAGGPYKAGKTTLANVLIGENNPMKWNSTAGLVIHFGRNGIDIKKKKMVRLIEDKSGHEVSAEILRGKQPILKTYEQLNKKGQKMSPDRTATPVQIYNSTSESPDTYTSLIKDTTHSTSHIAIQSHYAMTEYVEEYKGRHILNKAHGQITKIGQVDLQELQLSPDILNEVRNGRYQLEIAPSDLLDFGGPELYDITHQLCIQQRGSFLLMFDGRFGLHEQLNEYPQGVTASCKF
ncbi:Hypothetical predicted protein [Mytilus galloprovincialis]|uniref:Uncharacterized protein n=1 Tax=Mytilus galloprovincialis TaxID=29158 RepID=A0A8B6BHL4_MYTGA|nr:Hypothetical predicted protein [Mytilus galloprovincialis]